MYQWDASAQASYSYDSINKIFYSYDDPSSIAAKHTYAKEQQLGGFAFWFIGADDNSLNTLLKATSNFTGTSSNSENRESTIKTSNTQLHYLTTLKDIPNIQLISGIKAYKYGISLQSYRYNR